MKEHEIYYKALGLEIGASLDDINQAYKDLVFIWHPDRIPKDNQRLLEKATAKIQEINDARDRLRQIHQTSKQPVSNAASATNRTKSAKPPQHQKTYTDVSHNGSHHKETHHPDRHKETHHHYDHHKENHHGSTRPYYRDLSGADLKGANLKEKDLSGRNLKQADLSHADLSDSFLHKVNLEEANLYKANLFRANLLGANLKKANLQETNLIGADLSGADLTEADLRGAKISSGNRIMVKLTGAILTRTILPDGSVHR